MKDFKKLIVWQKGLTLYTDLHVYCKHLPPEEKFSLVSQIRRAAFSTRQHSGRAFKSDQSTLQALFGK